MPADELPRRGGGAIPRLPGRFRAVVFDMDGLLVDSEPLWLRAEQRLLQERGLDHPALAKTSTVGMAPRETLELYARLLDLDRSVLPGLWTDLRSIMVELYRTELVRQPGAVELVMALRGLVPLGIASNTDRDLVELALSVAGFDGTFDAVVSAAEVGRSKPAPDVYLEACRRLGSLPQDALALEDSPTGVAAAKAAGMAVAVVPQFEDIDIAAADWLIGSLAELIPGDRGPAA